MRGKAHACIGLLTYYNYSLLTGSTPDIVPAALSVPFALLADLDHYQSLISKKLSNPLIEKILESILMASVLLPVLYIYKIKGPTPYLFAIAVIILTAVIGIVIKKSIIRKLSISLIVLSLYLIGRTLIHTDRLIFLAAFLCIVPWLTHRSFSHSVFSVVLIYFIVKPIFSPQLTAACTVSYASHIFFGDFLTPSGVPVFFPLSRRRFSLIKTARGTKKIVSFLEFSVITLLSLLAIYLTYLLIY